MSYGVLLATAYGEVWVTPESTPLALYAKQSVVVSNPSAATTITQVYDVNRPIVPFVYTTGRGALWMNTENGVCTVSIRNAPAGTVMEVYFFSIFPQPLPAYGIAIWDAGGTCILTNETRTLADLSRIGGSGAAGDNGFNTNA